MEAHEHLSQEARVQAVKLEPMHIVDWKQAQEADVALAGCCKWLHLRKSTLPSPAGNSPQAVPWSRGRDGTGQDVLPCLQHSCPEPQKVEQRECWPSSFPWVNAAWHLMGCIMMPVIRANNGPWLSHKRGSGGP